MTTYKNINAPHPLHQYEKRQQPVTKSYYTVENSIEIWHLTQKDKQYFLGLSDERPDIEKMREEQILTNKE